MGWQNIAELVQNEMGKKQLQKLVIAVECYHGVFVDEIKANLQRKFSSATIIDSTTALKSAADIEKMVYPFVTDDPVFGYIAPLELRDFFDGITIESVQQKLKEAANTVIVIGQGASLIAPSADLLLYADMPRWEIQLRFRKNSISNIGAENKEAEFSYQYKRAFFVDWRVLDRHKKTLMHA